MLPAWETAKRIEIKDDSPEKLRRWFEKHPPAIEAADSLHSKHSPGITTTHEV
jgi:hypothetical protein